MALVTGTQIVDLALASRLATHPPSLAAPRRASRPSTSSHLTLLVPKKWEKGRKSVQSETRSKFGSWFQFLVRNHAGHVSLWPLGRAAILHSSSSDLIN